MEIVQDDDRDLIRRLKEPAGRDAAFALLIKRYQERIYWHVRKIVQDHDDADDVVQTTFIKAWKGIEGFREEAKLKTWLYRIATNEALTFVKRQKKQLTTEVEDIQNVRSHSETYSEFMEGEEIQRKLDQAVNQLPEKQRIVFCMKYFDEMKYDEIAAVLGGTVGSLKASFHHAVKKVEQFLQSN